MKRFSPFFSRGSFAFANGTRLHLPIWMLLFAPIFAGAWIMQAGGAALSRWGVHLGSFLIGLIFYHVILAISENRVRKVLPVAALAGFAAIAATLSGSGLSGVFRWHDIGALRIQPSALLSPAILVFAITQRHSQTIRMHLFLTGVQIVQILQPDAAQATAFGMSAIVLAMAGDSGRRKFIWAPIYAGSIALAWCRPDPLQPVAFVEDIVSRAFALSPVAGILALAAAVPFILTPYAIGNQGLLHVKHRTPETVMAVYFLALLVAPLFGAFPVPLLGYGPSSVIGAFMGLAFLKRLPESSRPDCSLE